MLNINFDHTVPYSFEKNAKQLFAAISAHIPLAKQTLQEAVKDGTITVKLINDNETPSLGHWDDKNRTICIRKSVSDTDKMGILLFELCNAANPGWKNRPQPEQFTSAEQYAESQERIEFNTANRSYEILRKIKDNTVMMRILKESGITSSDLSEGILSTPGDTYTNYMHSVKNEKVTGQNFCHWDIYRAHWDKVNKLNKVLKMYSHAPNSPAAFSAVHAITQEDFLAPYKSHATSAATNTSYSSTNVSAPPAIYASTPTATESYQHIKNLREGSYPYTTMTFFKSNMNYYLTIGKCYLQDMLLAAIDANNPDFIDFFIEQTRKLPISEITHLIKMFSIFNATKGKGPIEYASNECRFVISGKLEKAFSQATKQALGENATSVKTASLSSYGTSTTNFTPSYNASTYPTYHESKELIDNLSKGYPALAKSTFERNKSYYLGAGRCYLPDILKGAIDGDQTQFIAFLVRETAVLSKQDLEKLYEDFSRLPGVNGKDPKDYAISQIKFVASNCLLSAEFATDKAKFTY